MLIGRHAECARIDELLESARRSRGDALLVRGEAGVGKTALLTYAGTGEGVRVLRGTGIQAESELTYAAAHQLLRPLLHLVEAIPAPQAAAVRVALGMVSGAAPDRFLVALGLLSLLSEAAREQPLLCVLDDVQWCDSASTDALLFVVRRITTDPVAFLFSVRDEPGLPTFDLPAVTEVAVTGLSPEAAGELLAGAAGAPVPESVRSALVARTRGNPLALLEIARALRGSELTGREPLPDPLPVGERLERAFIDRSRRLSPGARRLLVVAAAEESGEADVITAAAVALGAGEDALADAEASGLLRVRRDRLEFCHPLARSAVYAEAPSVDRRAAHRALAASLEGLVGGGDDRRVWHLAGAAAGPDEAVAAELESVADAARQRSGHGSASAGYERAAELSPTAADRTRRLVAAAESAWLAGQAARLRDLVERAERTTSDPEVRGRLLHLRGRAAARGGEVDGAYGVLIQGAELVREAAPALALEMLADATDAAAYAGDNGRMINAAQLAATIAPGMDARSQFLSAWLYVGTGAARGNVSVDADRLRASIALAGELDDPRLMVWAGIAAVNLGDVAGMQHFFVKAVDHARRTGAVASMPYPLEHVSMSLAVSGSYASARSCAEEGLLLARETGQLGSACHLVAILAFIAASCGQEEECRGHAREALDLSARRGMGLPIATATWALGRLDLGLGRSDSALDRMLSMYGAKPGAGNPVVALWATPDTVDAAVRAGRPGEVAGAVEQLEAWAAAGGERGAAATVAWCRGLLGRGDPAAALAEAAQAFDELPLPYPAARAQLALGELLRRGKQRAAAREHLRSALRTFEQLGARPWADRAAAELRATGETVERDGAHGVDQLTPQELAIIRQVCQGASNRDVAAQLFLSPRTVEYHLYNAYPKLGVSSRTQLITRFAAGEELVGVR